MNIKSNREVKKTKSFKIENSLYKKFTKKLKNDDKRYGNGLTPSGFIRQQIILYLNDEDILFSKNKDQLENKPEC